MLGIYSRGICCHYHSHDEGGDWEAGERGSNQSLCEYSLASNGGKGEGGELQGRSPVLVISSPVSVEVI